MKLMSEFNQVLLIAYISNKFSVDELRALTRQPFKVNRSLLIYDQTTKLKLTISRCSRRGIQHHIHVTISLPNQRSTLWRIGIDEFPESLDEP